MATGDSMISPKGGMNPDEVCISFRPWVSMQTTNMIWEKRPRLRDISSTMMDKFHRRGFQ